MLSHFWRSARYRFYRMPNLNNTYQPPEFDPWTTGHVYPYFYQTLFVTDAVVALEVVLILLIYRSSIIVIIAPHYTQLQ